MAKVKAIPDGKEIRFIVPAHVYNLVREEASMYGMNMADFMRSILAGRYRDRLFDADAAATSPAVRAAREAEEVER